MRTNSPFQKERKQTLIWRKRKLIKANKPDCSCIGNAAGKPGGIFAGWID